MTQKPVNEKYTTLHEVARNLMKEGYSVGNVTENTIEVKINKPKMATIFEFIKKNTENKEGVISLMTSYRDTGSVAHAGVKTPLRQPQLLISIKTDKVCLSKMFNIGELHPEDRKNLWVGVGAVATAAVALLWALRPSEEDDPV